jgi:hypothetical protein
MCFNVPLILPAAAVVVAVNSVAAQTAIPLVDIKSVDLSIVIESRIWKLGNQFAVEFSHSLQSCGRPFGLA